MKQSKELNRAIIEILQNSPTLSTPEPASIQGGDYAYIALSDSLSSVRPSFTPTPSNAVSAVIFDIYGTLFSSAIGEITSGEPISGKNSSGTWDAEFPQANLLKSLLRKYGINSDPKTVQESLKNSIVSEHEHSRSCGVDYPEVDIRIIWRGMEYLSHVSDNNILLFASEYESIVNPVVPMPSAKELLLKLRSLPSISLGIVSNAQFYTPLLFNAQFGDSPQALGFSRELIIYSFEHGYAKPSTVLFEVLAERLSQQSPAISPKQTLYIGNDMLNDVWAAGQVGFQTAIFTGDSRSFRPREFDDRCKNLKADYQVAHVYDLLVLLQK